MGARRACTVSRMPQLVRGEAAPDSSGRRGVARLRASGRDTSAGRA